MPLDAAVRETTRAAMERLKVPGVAVGVLLDGEEIVEGFGVTSVENPLPVDRTTLFQIGSITKTFTATAVMQLVEQGLLDLDRPIRTYFPELRLNDEDVAWRVTLRHALGHTCGWPGDVFDDCEPGEDAIARMVERIASCVRDLLRWARFHLGDGTAPKGDIAWLAWGGRIHARQ